MMVIRGWWPCPPSPPLSPPPSPPPSTPPTTPLDTPSSFSSPSPSPSHPTRSPYSTKHECWLRLNPSIGCSPVLLRPLRDVMTYLKRTSRNALAKEPTLLDYNIAAVNELVIVPAITLGWLPEGEESNILYNIGSSKLSEDVKFINNLRGNLFVSGRGLSNNYLQSFALGKTIGKAETLADFALNYNISKFFEVTSNMSKNAGSSCFGRVRQCMTPLCPLHSNSMSSSSSAPLRRVVGFRHAIFTILSQVIGSKPNLDYDWLAKAVHRCVSATRAPSSPRLLNWRRIRILRSAAALVLLHRYIQSSIIGQLRSTDDDSYVTNLDTDLASLVYLSLLHFYEVRFDVSPMDNDASLENFSLDVISTEILAYKAQPRRGFCVTGARIGIGHVKKKVLLKVWNMKHLGDHVDEDDSLSVFMFLYMAKILSPTGLLEQLRYIKFICKDDQVTTWINGALDFLRVNHSAECLELLGLNFSHFATSIMTETTEAFSGLINFRSEFVEGDEWNLNSSIENVGCELDFRSDCLWPYMLQEQMDQHPITAASLAYIYYLSNGLSHQDSHTSPREFICFLTYVCGKIASRDKLRILWDGVAGKNNNFLSRKVSNSVSSKFLSLVKHMLLIRGNDLAGFLRKEIRPSGKSLVEYRAPNSSKPNLTPPASSNRVANVVIDPVLSHELVTLEMIGVSQMTRKNDVSFNEFLGSLQNLSVNDT